jgi:hypothetical protein
MKFDLHYIYNLKFKYNANMCFRIIGLLNFSFFLSFCFWGRNYTNSCKVWFNFWIGECGISLLDIRFKHCFLHFRLNIS